MHALTGVMSDHNATTGVLVTTSSFGRASEQFAQHNRLTLINGAELKHLLKKHAPVAGPQVMRTAGVTAWTRPMWKTLSSSRSRHQAVRKGASRRIFSITRVVGLPSPLT
ncbi:Restriction endonuclease [Actinomadura mexicana]|uniref:Restriction endonuclease n=1 Tax=Actinomadura mexicana TaxID=134959 RepID=A0A239AV23_9ACTN|nr:Restriction endonuclease [Actinomadura mexicana]